MPRRLLSTLSHVELLTPKLDESVAFARDILGLDIDKEVGNTVYLRCWGDYYRYSIALTAADGPGLGHAGWRTEGADELDEAVARLNAAGVQGDWFDDSYGHGRAYRYTGPGGHCQEIFWEIDRAVAPAGEESVYPDRPQRPPAHGIGPRLLDHLTVTTPDVEATANWLRDMFGSRKYR